MYSSRTLKRIQADIKNVLNDDIKTQGIHYESNEADITEGIAMIIGQKDTPYEGGFYFFSVKFPIDYPFSPPAMSSLTQDGLTRFNPNMYREGKVCLSLLNTWHAGERWSGCQTLSSILLSILTSVLIDKPLQNEPGFENKVNSEISVIYTRMVLHANLNTAILKQLISPSKYAILFFDRMRNSFLSNRNRLVHIAVAETEYDNLTQFMDFFRMTVCYNFSILADKIRELVIRDPQ